MQFHYQYLVYWKRPVPKATPSDEQVSLTIAEVKKRKETMQGEVKTESKKIEDFALSNEKVAKHLGIDKDELKKYLKRNQEFDDLLSDMHLDAGGSYSRFLKYTNSFKLKGVKVKLTEVHSKMLESKKKTMKKLTTIRTSYENKLDAFVEIESTRDDILQSFDDEALSVAKKVCGEKHKDKLYEVYNTILKSDEYKSTYETTETASSGDIKKGGFITKEFKASLKSEGEKSLEYAIRPEVTSYGVHKKEGLVTLILEGEELGGVIYAPKLGKLFNQSHKKVGTADSLKKEDSLDFKKMAAENIGSMIMSAREELKFKMSEDLVAKASSELANEYAKEAKEFLKKRLDLIQIEGSASNDGGYASNKALALRRAYAERDRVAKILGVDPRLIKNVKGKVVDQHGNTLNSSAASRKFMSRYLSAYNARFNENITMAELNKRISAYNRDGGTDREGFFKTTLGNYRRADVVFGLEGKNKKTPTRFNISTSAPSKDSNLTS